MEFLRRYFRQCNRIFLQFHPQLWYRHYFNDHPYQGPLISPNAKTDGLHQRDAGNSTFNERAAGKI